MFLTRQCGICTWLKRLSAAYAALKGLFNSQSQFAVILFTTLRFITVVQVFLAPGTPHAQNAANGI